MPRVLYDHALGIKKSTIKLDLDKYASRVYPNQHSLANSKAESAATDPRVIAAAEHVRVFKDNTQSLIERLIKIISHETERLILLVMPDQEDTAIFKLLVHHRRKYLSDRHSADEAHKPDPYTAADSFAYL